MIRANRPAIIVSITTWRTGGCDNALYFAFARKCRLSCTQPMAIKACEGSLSGTIKEAPFFISGLRMYVSPIMELTAQSGVRSPIVRCIPKICERLKTSQVPPYRMLRGYIGFTIVLALLRSRPGNCRAQEGWYSRRAPKSYLWLQLLPGILSCNGDNGMVRRLGSQPE
jgi:hypothetical protein